MNSDAPRGTRRLRSPAPLTTDRPPGMSKKSRVASSPDTSTAPSIHQSGDHASIIIQGSYNEVGRDQYITNVGRKL